MGCRYADTATRDEYSLWCVLGHREVDDGRTDAVLRRSWREGLSAASLVRAQPCPSRAALAARCFTRIARRFQIGVVLCARLCPRSRRLICCASAGIVLSQGDGPRDGVGPLLLLFSEPPLQSARVRSQRPTSLPRGFRRPFPSFPRRSLHFSQSLPGAVDRQRCPSQRWTPSSLRTASSPSWQPNTRVRTNRAPRTRPARPRAHP